MRKPTEDQLAIAWVAAWGIWGLVVLPLIYLHDDAGHSGAVNDLAVLVTALATIAIAGFTFSLKRSTDKLWEAGEKQLRLAREEFISTHRPKLIVRQFVFIKPIPGQPLKVEFSIVNTGDTEAVWRYWHSEVALWNGKYWEAPGLDHIVKPASSLKPIKNGQRVGVTIHSRFDVTAAQIADVEQGKLIVGAVGEITYADALKTNRRTGFRRHYDISNDMFIASPHDDHEYRD